MVPSLIWSLIVLTNILGMVIGDTPQSIGSTPAYEERKKIYSELMESETRARKEVSLLKIKNNWIESEGAKNKWRVG